MRRSKFLIPGLALVLAFSLTACGMGKRQSPVASDEEVGRTHASEEEEKPLTYATKDGDTLGGIAARPEIYGEPGLWPLIQDANADSVGDKSSSTRLKADLLLDIPRGLDTDAIDEAREKARQASAAAKSKLAPKRAEPAAPAVKEAAKPSSTKALAPAAKPAKDGKAVAKTATEAAKVPKAKSGSMFPLFLLLLLVLAGLGAVLYVFSKRDKEDGA